MVVVVVSAHDGLKLEPAKSLLNGLGIAGGIDDHSRCALLAAISHDEAIVIHHADDERRNGHAAVIDGHLAFAICTHSHTFLLAPVGRIARQHTTRVEHAVNFS